MEHHSQFAFLTLNLEDLAKLCHRFLHKFHLSNSYSPSLLLAHIFDRIDSALTLLTPDVDSYSCDRGCLASNFSATKCDKVLHVELERLVRILLMHISSISISLLSGGLLNALLQLDTTID